MLSRRAGRNFGVLVEGALCREGGQVGVEKGRKAVGWSARLRWLRRMVGPWQPLTGSGVAAFRAASLSRILTLQVVTAGVSTFILLAVVRRIWFPVLLQGMTQLPDVAGIADGKLHWPNAAPRRLAENIWLDWIVTPGRSTDLGQTADLQVELWSTEARIHGFAGRLTLPYLAELEVPLGRIEATARWGAWSWVLLLAAGMAAGLFFLVSWWSLATIYTLPLVLVGIMLGRRARVTGAWRMSAAALIPGALFADWAMLAYGLGAVRLPGFLVLFTLHLVIGWSWMFWGLLRSPLAGSREPENPFEHEGADD